MPSACNSAATLRGLVRPGDFARVGIALFGPQPIQIAAGTIEPVLRWRTEIMRLKELPAGHAIGYGTTFHTTRPSRIATLPVGYADGYDRELSPGENGVVNFFVHGRVGGPAARDGDGVGAAAIESAAATVDASAAGHPALGRGGRKKFDQVYEQCMTRRGYELSSRGDEGEAK